MAIVKNESEKVIDLLIYKNPSVLIKNLHLFLNNHTCKILCRGCLSSYTSEIVIMKHEQNCEQQENMIIKTQKILICFRRNNFIRILYVFGYMQSLKLIRKLILMVYVIKQLILTNKVRYVKDRFHIVSEIDDVLKSGVYESPLGYDIADSFVDDVIKLEIKTAFYFRNTYEDIKMIQKGEHYRDSNNCRFCETKSLLTELVTFLNEQVSIEI